MYIQMLNATDRPSGMLYMDVRNRKEKESVKDSDSESEWMKGWLRQH